ncbi:calmodulin [Dermacentor silvarum]|uniref:calmodulin n=1 Tax=Dermacentor silvarum TaxID=543639 RepID=UPI0021009C33|nr:calmodulin [Dermacentor silvarum]
MPAKRVVLWKNESVHAPSSEISATGSFRPSLSDSGDEHVRRCSIITDFSTRRRFFTLPSHHRRRCYALDSPESSTTLSRVPRYECRLSAANIANSDCSSSICSDSSISLQVPSDASELLEEDETARLRQAFELFDHNCDGLITAQELGAVMLTLGYEESSVEVERMVTEANTSGKDNVDFSEFLAVLVQQPDAPIETIQAEIEVALQATDLRHVMSSLNESVTDRELDSMMIAADKDGDGLISYEEFVALFSPDQVVEEPA